MIVEMEAASFIGSLLKMRISPNRALGTYLLLVLLLLNFLLFLYLAVSIDSNYLHFVSFLRFPFTLYYRPVPSHACSGKQFVWDFFFGKESTMTSERRLIKCLSPFPFFSTTTTTTTITTTKTKTAAAAGAAATSTATTATTAATPATPAPAPAPACKLWFYAVHLYVSSCRKALSHRVLAEHVMVLHQDTQRAKHKHRFPEPHARIQFRNDLF